MSKITPGDVGKLLGISAQAVRVQMQKGILDVGIAVENENGRYSYIISPKKVYELTGAKIEGFEPPTEVRIDEERLAINIAKALLPYLTKGA